MTSKNVVCKVKAILSRFGLDVLPVTMALISALTNRCWSNENSSIKNNYVAIAVSFGKQITLASLNSEVWTKLPPVYILHTQTHGLNQTMIVCKAWQRLNSAELLRIYQ